MIYALSNKILSYVRVLPFFFSIQQSKLSCHGNEDPPEDPPSPQEKKFDWSMPVLLLPYSLLHKLFLQLRLPMPRGNDWTGFAGMFCSLLLIHHTASFGLWKRKIKLQFTCTHVYLGIDIKITPDNCMV